MNAIEKARPKRGVGWGERPAHDPRAVSWRPFFVACGGGFAVVFAIAYCFANAECFHQRSFDREAWINNHDLHQRHDMIADLKRRLRPGTSKERVLELLGRPDFASRPGLLSYDVGPSRGFIALDADSLELLFDDNERLLLLQVVSH